MTHKIGVQCVFYVACNHMAESLSGGAIFFI